MTDAPADPPSPTLLEQHLAARQDACPMCGYNLHKLRGNHCPECGQSLELQIALTEPRMAAFHTGLVGLAAGVGFTGLVLLWGLIALLRRGGPQSWQLLFLFGETIVLSALLATWLRHSGRLRRLPTATRWTLACGTWVMTLAAVLIFGLAVAP